MVIQHGDSILAEPQRGTSWYSQFLLGFYRHWLLMYTSTWHHLGLVCSARKQYIDYYSTSHIDDGISTLLWFHIATGSRCIDTLSPYFYNTRSITVARFVILLCTVMMTAYLQSAFVHMGHYPLIWPGQAVSMGGTPYGWRPIANSSGCCAGINCNKYNVLTTKNEECVGTQIKLKKHQAKFYSRPRDILVECQSQRSLPA